MLLLYSGGWTHIYMGDEDDIDEVKKDGEDTNLGKDWTRVNTNESYVVRRASCWFGPQN